MQKLAELCVRRPVFATMLILSLVVLGLFSYASLGVDLFPDIDFPVVTVTTTLPGASPEEVETTVSRRIEESVNTIGGIDELRSISAEGISQVVVSFVLEKDGDVAAQEVRDKINSVLRDLPDDIDPPVIEKLQTDASPVLSIAVSSDESLRAMTERVENLIKENIETINGVGQVRFVGDRRRQIQIVVDAGRLAAYNLTVEELRAALASQNVEIPGGRLEEGRQELTLRTLGRVENPADFGRIVVATIGGAPVRVGDLAEVRDTVEEPRTVARLDGRPAVLLEVRKQSGTNAVGVIHAIKERMEEIRPLLPAGYAIAYVRDQSAFIEASFEAVQEHLVLGGVFAGLIVLLFLRSVRPTIIAAVAIPTSVIATFTLISYMGFTLNQITMLALTLVVGIVIDDAIVVLENIYRFMDEKGLGPVQAAIEGTREVGMAVMITTLSLVIVFLPVAYMSGIVGRFMSSFGFTAAFAIMVSLLVSFTLTPMLCSRYLRARGGPGHSTRESGFYRRLSAAYDRMLAWCLRRRALVCTGALAISLTAAPLFIVLGKDFLPQDDQSEFEITVRAPVGSSPAATEDLLGRIEAEVVALPHVASYLTTLGADTQNRADRGSILVGLTPMNERPLSQSELMALTRTRLLERFPALNFSVLPPAAISGGAGTNAELQYFVQGPDLDVLGDVAARIQETLAALPGVVDIESSFEGGKPEVRAHINRDRAADLGVSVSAIAGALRVLVGGDAVTTFRDGDDRYDVLLRVDEANRNGLDAVNRLYVPSSRLGNVPVSNVVTLDRGEGPSQIDRYNRQRQITLSANILPGQSLSNVIQQLDAAIAELDLPPTVQVGLQGASRELQRAAVSYLVALILSLTFMYIVLAALFESFVDPLTVMSTLPLSIPFALLPLFLTGQNFSIIYSSLGVLMLFGVVKKNAILQVDHINHLRRDQGLPRLEAVRQGCADRLRPILMTTLSLVAGMIPLALGGGAGAASRQSVAVIVIGGQTLCLLLTLLVAPVIYTVLDDLVASPRWGRLGAAMRWRPARSRVAES